MRDTRRTKRKKADNWLTLALIERNIRARTDQLYDARGHVEGRELEDWLKALSEAIRTMAVAPSRADDLRQQRQQRVRTAKIA